MAAAAGEGQLASSEWLLNLGCPWHGALAAAALNGHANICRWLLAKGCPASRCAVVAAARGGHVGLVYWLLLQNREQAHSNNDVIGPLELLVAAAEGFITSDLQRLHAEELAESPSRQGVKQQPEQLHQPQPLQVQELLPQPLDAFMGPKILAAAAGSPTPDWQAKVLWLEPRMPGPRDACACEAVAAIRPDTEAQARLHWLRQRGYPATTSAARAAAGAGNVAALRFLLMEGIRPDFLVPAKAFAEGQLGVLQELHAHGCDLRPRLHISTAVRHGHLHVLVWIVEALGVSVAPSNEVLVSAAAQYGDLELAAWLRERGCQFAEVPSAFAAAAAGGSEAMMEWLVGLGCPLPANDTVYVYAATRGDLATLRCLRRLGCAWSGTGETFTRCILGGSFLAALRCLRELDCPVDWVEALAAMERRREAEVEDGDDEGSGRVEELAVWLRAERQRHGVAA
ncbi:hypothetical protein PLESTF_001722700 [Pleodorina starrii]|nr:hypothetical protein PLESTF_001722700 [Pleodorina starrii]